MFFSRKIPVVNLLNNFTDCHSHILPGVDDGVRSAEEALHVLSFYEEQGIKRVIITPHIMEGLPKNRVEFLRSEFAKFQVLYKGQIELTLAAEYMLDSGFNKHLKSGELLCLFDNYVLVEMSYAVATVDYMSIISEIMSQGYFVVLAHPERYLYLQKEEYLKLKSMDVKFQLNIPSILGTYGKEVQKRADQLLSFSMYDIMGSDIHSYSYHYNLLNSAKISSRQLKQLLQINNLCVE